MGEADEGVRVRAHTASARPGNTCKARDPPSRVGEGDALCLCASRWREGCITHAPTVVPVAPARPQNRREEPGVERGHAREHQPARQRPEARSGQDLREPVDRLGESGLGPGVLEPRRGDLQHPGEQQDREHPAVIAPQPPAEGLAQADVEHGWRRSSARRRVQPGSGFPDGTCCPERRPRHSSAARAGAPGCGRRRRSGSAVPRCRAAASPAAWRRAARRDAPSASRARPTASRR